jgi:kynurenine formamidase
MHTFKHASAFSFLTTLVISCAGCDFVQEIQQPQPAVRPSDGLLEGLSDERTRILDLTHTLNANNPYWPGEGYTPFEYETFASLEEDGVLSGRFAMAEHTGTHLDAPNHFVQGQLSVDRIPVEQLIVPGIVIDARIPVAENADYQLSVVDLLAWERANGLVPPNSVVFLHTGWDQRWQDFASYRNEDDEGRMHFPGFSPEVTTLLVSNRGIAGLGIDTLSVDYGLSIDFDVHAISHGGGLYHIENAANLGELPATGSWIVVAPIKVEGGTGGPARILAISRNSLQQTSPF